MEYEMDITKILQDELDSLIKGKTDIKRAKAVCDLSAQIIYKERLSVESNINEAKIRYWNKEAKK